MRGALPAWLTLGIGRDAGLVVAVVGLGLALLRFDFSLNVALPAISSALGEDLGGVQWAIAVYLLVQVALLPVCGALADWAGHRTVYLAGLAFFTASAIIAATALTLPHLLVGRALQGVGAALLLAGAPALIVATLPSEQRGRALGYVGATQAAGQIAGPTVGGALVDLFGWAAIFTIRVPVGLVLLVLSWFLLPAAYTRRGEPLDSAGALTLGLGATALLYGLSRLANQGLAFEAVAALAGGALALIAFVALERRAQHPLLPFGLLRAPVFAALNLSWVLAWTAVFGIWLVFPFFLARALGLPAGPAGALLAIVALGMTLAPVPFGAWADRCGPRLPGIVGLLLIIAGLGLLARLDGTAPWPLVALALALVGCGIGGFQSPNNALLMHAVGPRELGVGSGVIALGRNLGVVTGVVFASSVLSVREAGYRAGGQADLAAFVHAHQDAFLAATLLAAVALAIYLWGIRRQR
jgi:EmrB/QacA subfamily drug resistance transporter